MDGKFTVKEKANGDLCLFAEGVFAGSESIIIDLEPGITLAHAHDLARSISEAGQLRTVPLYKSDGISFPRESKPVRLTDYTVHYGVGGDVLLVSDIDPSNSLLALPLMPGTSVERAFSLARRVRDSFEPMGAIVEYNEPRRPGQRFSIVPKAGEPGPDDTGR